ncbi:MAG: TIM44-like domain-containing protein [Thermoleophilaceae bacterium]
MPGLARRAALTAVLALIHAPAAVAAAGGGSSSFGGGGGSSGGGSSGGGGGGSGDFGLFDAVLFGLIALGVVAIFIAAGVASIRYARRRRARAAAVGRVSLAAAEDDSAFHPDMVRRWADYLFREAQAAWDARDHARLAAIVGADLLVEWTRRLDDFEAKGWHNRVELPGPVEVEYLGLVNRADDGDDRAVVRIEARLRDYVVDRNGAVIKADGATSTERTLQEWWTLGKRDSRWIVFSIEQEAEGRHNLDGRLVATPADDAERLGDAVLVDLAAQDKVAPGFTVADVADLDFDGDARAAALDLSLADARFAPDLLEAAARRVVSAWAEAVDGDDAPLEAVASPEAVRRMLHPSGDGTRLVVRGPVVRRVHIARLDAATQPPVMSIEVEVSGRRYVEDRDTAAVVSGSRSAEARFTERWTLALDGPDAAPWRIVDAAAEAVR